MPQCLNWCLSCGKNTAHIGQYSVLHYNCSNEEKVKERRKGFRQVKRSILRFEVHFMGQTWKASIFSVKQMAWVENTGFGGQAQKVCSLSCRGREYIQMQRNTAGMRGMKVVNSKASGGTWYGSNLKNAMLEALKIIMRLYFFPIATNIYYVPISASQKSRDSLAGSQIL